MQPSIKAVVFKTPKLSATKQFFSDVLGFVIKESTVKHFVVNSKDIRIVFMEFEPDFEVELFLNSEQENIQLEDPNNIQITASKRESLVTQVKIITDKNSKHEK